MIEKRVEVKNKSGLHARPAAVFVETTKKFKSKITVIKDGKSADGKNILQILALGVDYGDEIVLQISGEDEKEAARELIDLLERVLPSEDK